MSRFQTWRAGWRKPDRRPINDWLHDHWTLPASYAQPGRFDAATSRHLIKPWEAIQADAVREVSVMAAIQTGKTLLVEGAIGWAICNSPGPVMWTLQTDEDAREHCNQRFMEALKSIAQIRAMLPEDRHLKQMAAIYFGPFFLEVNGANLNNLQRVSVRWKFNSEVWLWKQGLLSHARGRVSAFEKAGNSKVVNESQGGNSGDDFDLAWKAGSQEVWSIRCFGCGQLQPLEFAGHMTTDPTKRACVVWNEDARRSDGSWNVGRAVETARWDCPSCGQPHADTPATRAKWNSSGEYVSLRPEAPAQNKSFRWEALVARDMGALVAQFLEARKQQKLGVIQPMQDFTRQRRALPWREDDASEIIVLSGAGYKLTDATIADKIPNESRRFLTVDRQRDHFWVLVRAWRADASSRLLYRSRVTTPEQIADIMIRFNVEPQLVFEDAGYFPNGVYTDCAKYGWTALKGSGDNSFSVEVRGKKVKRMWSDVTRVLHDGKQIPLIHWCSDPIKDILYNLRSGRGAPWETADDSGEEYQNQINGDKKKERINKKTGRPEWRWMRIHANHMHDLEAMQVAAALMLGILLPPKVDEEPVTNESKSDNGQSPPEK